MRDDEGEEEEEKEEMPKLNNAKSTQFNGSWLPSSIGLGGTMYVFILPFFQSATLTVASRLLLLPGLLM